MGPMEESSQKYEQQRRRLNARLGLVVFALLPLPAILIAVGLSPLRMLLVVASLGVSIGILYPMWWRTKHNPVRASVVESAYPADRLGLPAKWVSLRPSSDVVLVGGKQSAQWVALAFVAAAALLLWFSYFSDKKVEQKLRSA